MLEEAVRAFRDGKFILLYDFDDRERETDFAIRADAVTRHHIMWMRKDGGGLICTAVHPEAAGRLGLPFARDLMSAYQGVEKIGEIPYDRKNPSSFGRAYPVSSSSISQMVTAGVTPAKPARAMESSVWPHRTSRSPSAALRIAQWPGLRKIRWNSVPPPPFMAAFTWSAMALMVRERSRSVIPVKVFRWFTQMEKEEGFFRS